MLIAESVKEKWILNLIARQQEQYNPTILTRVYTTLTTLYSYSEDFMIKNPPWKYLVAMSPECKKAGAFDELIQNNSSYLVFIDTFYFVFMKTDEDLNLLRLSFNSKDLAIFDLTELNNNLGLDENLKSVIL